MYTYINGSIHIVENCGLIEGISLDGGRQYADVLTDRCRGIFGFKRGQEYRVHGILFRDPRVRCKRHVESFFR